MSTDTLPPGTPFNPSTQDGLTGTADLPILSDSEVTPLDHPYLSGYSMASDDQGYVRLLLDLADLSSAVLSGLNDDMVDTCRDQIDLKVGIATGYLLAVGEEFANTDPTPDDRTVFVPVVSSVHIAHMHALQYDAKARVEADMRALVGLTRHHGLVGLYDAFGAEDEHHSYVAAVGVDQIRQKQAHNAHTASLSRLFSSALYEDRPPTPEQERAAQDDRNAEAMQAAAHTHTKRQAQADANPVADMTESADTTS